MGGPPTDLTFNGIPIVFDPARDENDAYLVPAEYESEVRRIVRKHLRKHPRSRVRVVTFTNFSFPEIVIPEATPEQE